MKRDITFIYFVAVINNALARIFSTQSAGRDAREAHFGILLNNFPINFLNVALCYINISLCVETR